MSHRVLISFVQTLIVLGVLFVVGIGAIIGAIGTVSYIVAYQNMARCFSRPRNLCPNYQLILSNDLHIAEIGALVLVIGIIMIILVAERGRLSKVKGAESEAIVAGTVDHCRIFSSPHNI